MPGDVGSIRQWEFCKLRVQSLKDAHETADIMEQEGWTTVSWRLNPVVFKRPDGVSKIAAPVRWYLAELDESLSIGDQAEKGQV